MSDVSDMSDKELTEEVIRFATALRKSLGALLDPAGSFDMASDLVHEILPQLVSLQALGGEMVERHY